MTPIAMPFPPRSTDDTIAKLQHGISECASMCSALGEFLAAAFPHAKVEADNLGTWLERYLNHNTKEYLETLRNPPPMPAGYSPFDPIDHLASLCKRRDNLQSQLDSFEEMVQACGGRLGDEGQNMMRAQIGLSGIPQQLEDLNEQISNFQRQNRGSGEVTTCPQCGAQTMPKVEPGSRCTATACQHCGWVKELRPVPANAIFPARTASPEGKHGY